MQFFFYSDLIHNVTDNSFFFPCNDFSASCSKLDVGSDVVSNKIYKSYSPIGAYSMCCKAKIIISFYDL